MSEFEVLELISTAWAGKQIYFMEEDGSVFSRESGYAMSVYDAIHEFASKIKEDF